MKVKDQGFCQAIRDFHAQLRQIRVKGMNNHYPFGQQCEPGALGDIVDWRSVFEAVKEVSYEGYVELVAYAWFPSEFPAQDLCLGLGAGGGGRCIGGDARGVRE